MLYAGLEVTRLLEELGAKLKDGSATQQEIDDAKKAIDGIKEEILKVESVASDLTNKAQGLFKLIDEFNSST
ncbi:hypothetical protein C0J52_21075 [Blattella germanica]|nr:hypothetical protein C0J52_21075 [Blattella germanica]